MYTLVQMLKVSYVGKKYKTHKKLILIRYSSVTEMIIFMFNIHE